AAILRFILRATVAGGRGGWAAAVVPSQLRRRGTNLEARRARPERRLYRRALLLRRRPLHQPDLHGSVRAASTAQDRRGRGQLRLGAVPQADARSEFRATEALGQAAVQPSAERDA